MQMIGTLDLQQRRLCYKVPPKRVEALTRPAARSFLTRAYPTMKKNNPNTPILLREAAGTLPKVYARYGASERPATAPPPPRLVGSPRRGAPVHRAFSLTPLTEFGNEKGRSLEGLTDKQIEEALTDMVKNSA